MFFKHLLTTIPFVPTAPAQIALYLPRRLWMIKKSAQLAVARRAENHAFFVFSVLFCKTTLAYEQARFHLPLPLGLVSVLVPSKLFATHGTKFRSILL